MKTKRYVAPSWASPKFAASRLAGVVLGVVSLLCLSVQLSSAADEFQGLGDLGGGSVQSRALAVSGDGRVVVGESESAFGVEAFRWTSGGGMLGLTDLPGGSYYSSANAVSFNGSVVVGTSNSANGSEAFRWNAFGGMFGLSDPNNDTFMFSANAVSADGQIVFGMGDKFVGPTEAVQWTSANGMVELGTLTGNSEALGVSADGSVVVGYSGQTTGPGSSFEAFRWTSATGMVGIGNLPGAAELESSAHAVSLDGSVVVGSSRSPLGREAFRWTSADGMASLGDLPGGNSISSALDVSPDGSVVVGYGNIIQGRRAIVWDAASGMRNLGDVLIQDFGLDLTGWTLTTATGISDDGLTIVGEGTNPDGDTEAWRVQVDANWVSRSSGSWDSRQNWAMGINPNQLHDLLVTPANGLTVTGPSTDRAVKSFIIGAQSQGVAELRLQPSGEIQTIEGITINDRGRISGSGIVESNVVIQPGGELAAFGGDNLHIAGNVGTNLGQVNALGGDLSLAQSLTNGSGSQINILNGSLTVASVPTFVTDLTGWQAAVTEVEALITTATAVSAADEVAAPPPNNEGLGKVLTFQSASTTLSRSFRLTALEPGTGARAGFIFNDFETGPDPSAIFENALSVGDINNFEDDDWQMESLDGPGLFAFGFELRNNDDTEGETVSVFGPDDVVLGRFNTIPAQSGPQFVGVISPYPITRVEYDENPDSNDIAIANFRFGSASIPVGTPLGLVNQAGAEINAVNGILNVPANSAPDDVGLTNLGTLNLTNSTVNGDVHNPAGSTLNFAGLVTLNGFVSGGANFSGNGGATVLINGGYSPGDSAAEVVVDGNLILSDSNTLFVEIGGITPGTDSDRLVVTDSVTLGGMLDVSLISPFTPSRGQSFEIVDVGGSLTGTFSGLPQAALVGNFGGTDLFINYTGGDGNDVVLFTGPLGLIGDTDDDGDVDIDDLNAVRNNFGSMGPDDGTLDGDAFPFDGMVNIDDLNAVRNNFGIVAAVPEPAAWWLALATAMMLGINRSGRSK